MIQSSSVLVELYIGRHWGCHWYPLVVLLFRIAVKKVGVMKKNDSELQCSCRTVHWGCHWYPLVVLLFRIAVKKVGVMKKNDSELQCSCRTVHWGCHWYPLVVLGTIDAFFLYLCWDQRSSLHLDE